VEKYPGLRRLGYYRGSLLLSHSALIRNVVTRFAPASIIDQAMIGSSLNLGDLAVRLFPVTCPRNPGPRGAGKF